MFEVTMEEDVILGMEGFPCKIICVENNSDSLRRGEPRLRKLLNEFGYRMIGRLVSDDIFYNDSLISPKPKALAKLNEFLEISNMKEGE